VSYNTSVKKVKEKMHSVYRVVRGDFDRQALQAQKMAENRRRKKCLKVVTILSILIAAGYRLMWAFI
jgi:hypothetical protein